MREKSVLIVLVILAVGLIETSLSALYQQNEYFGEPPIITFKESYDFPLGWQVHSWTETGVPIFVPVPSPKVYWFSLESFLLDATFWVAISFFACIATMKSVNILHQTRASKNLSVINI